MKVTLLGYVDDVERIIAACSEATRSKPSDSLLTTLSQEDARKHIARVLSRGHEGISEFAYFIFSISDVSRVLTHQLVRHRIASYLQMSSREMDLSNVDFVVPPKIKEGSKTAKIFEEAVDTARARYKELLTAGIKYEDARYLLPSCIETHISVAMNARSLNNLFGLRLCGRAQWEIRELAAKMREIVKLITPSLFWSEPRPCVRQGFCPEGKKSCGFWKSEEFQKEREKFKRGYPNE